MHLFIQMGLAWDWHGIGTVTMKRVPLGVLAVSFLLTSCSSTDTLKASMSLKPSNLSMLRQAVKTTESASSFQLYLKVNAVSGYLKGDSVTLSGVFGTSYRHKEARIFCVYHKNGISRNLISNMRVIGPNTFLEPLNKTSVGSHGKTWIETTSLPTLSSFVSLFWPLFSLDGRFDPLTTLSFLQHSTHVRSEGTGVFGGKRQYVYKLSTTSGLSPLATSTKLNNIEVSLEISPKGQLSKVSIPSIYLVGKTGTETEVSFSLEMFSYSIPLNVSPPQRFSVLTAS